MSEKRSTKSLLLIALMMVSLSSPIFSSSAAADSDSQSNERSYDAQGVIIGDLADFDVSEGREYLLFDEETPVVSAYGFMKQAWSYTIARGRMPSRN